jgi:predicted transport protein
VNRFKQSNNIVCAVPKSKFVRVEIFFDNVDDWVEILQNKGIHVVSTSRNKVLKIRIDRDTITYHQELIHELFKQAVEYSFKINSLSM